MVYQLLVFFLGPSGVGKTTIMKLMTGLHGWRKIPVYTTRKARDGDDKISVDPTDFLKMADRNAFFRQAEMFGEMYGNDRVSVVSALSRSSEEFWCLDLKDTELQYYPYNHALKIVLLPENGNQLLDQISSAKRNEKRRDVESELVAYRRLAMNNLGTDFMTLLNSSGRQRDVAKQARDAAVDFLRG